VSSINTHISATTGAIATAHNVRQVLKALTRVFLAPSSNSVSNDAAGLSVAKNQIHNTILRLGRNNETDTVMATQCTRKLSSDWEFSSEKTNSKTNVMKYRSCTRIDLREYSSKAFELARIKITSLIKSATLAISS
jgi:hypothetical protein